MDFVRKKMAAELPRRPPLLRVNQISLGPFERKVLPRMAARLPRQVTPDLLTAIAFFSAILIGVSYWLTQYSLHWIWVANLCLVLHWWGDSLDGTLARVRRIQRERYGFFVDHFSDTISVFLILLGLGLSPLMDLRAALLDIIGYYGMSILVYLVSISRGVFRISYMKMGPTEARLLLIVINTIVWAFHNPSWEINGAPFTLFSILGLFGGVAMLGMLAAYGEAERRRLAVLDPAPTAPSGAVQKEETPISIPIEN